MTRQEFWQWMQTCPAHSTTPTSSESGWFVANDNGDDLRIFFWFDEECDNE